MNPSPFVSDEKVEQTLDTLKEQYRVVNAFHLKPLYAWLSVGVFAGISMAVALIANQNGTFPDIFAAGIPSAILGYHITSTGVNDAPPATITINRVNKNGHIRQTIGSYTDNPYNTGYALPEGIYTITSSVPDGYEVSYSRPFVDATANDADLWNSASYTKGNSVTIDTRQFKDKAIGLWWRYTQVSGSTGSSLQSILYNPGPTRKCWQHQNNFTRPGVSDSIGFTSLKDSSECIPDNDFRLLWEIVTHAWSLARKGQWPGWDVGVYGSAGQPIEVVLKNHSANPSPEEPDKCMVYETSFDWSFPNNSFKLHPSGRSYRIGDFSELHHKFDAKLDHFASLPDPQTNQPWCPSFNNANVNADLVVTYVDCDPNAGGGGVARNTDIMSLWLYNGTGFDGNNNPNDDIAFNSCPTTVGSLPGATLCLKQFHAAKLGIPVLTKSYQSYDIDMLPIYKSKFPPPPGNCTYANAQINHVEVYTAARGHDLDISVRNLDVLAK